MNKAPLENQRLVLVCLRILMRDDRFQKLFFNNDGVKSLAEVCLFLSVC
jgi:hypothetical protein